MRNKVKPRPSLVSSFEGVQILEIRLRQQIVLWKYVWSSFWYILWQVVCADVIFQPRFGCKGLGYFARWHFVTTRVKQLFSLLGLFVNVTPLQMVTHCYLLLSTDIAKKGENQERKWTWCMPGIYTGNQRDIINWHYVLWRYISLIFLGGQIKAFSLTNYPPAWMAVT